MAESQRKELICYCHWGGEKRVMENHEIIYDGGITSLVIVDDHTTYDQFVIDACESIGINPSGKLFQYSDNEQPRQMIHLMDQRALRLMYLTNQSRIHVLISESEGPITQKLSTSVSKANVTEASAHCVSTLRVPEAQLFERRDISILTDDCNSNLCIGMDSQGCGSIQNPSTNVKGGGQISDAAYFTFSFSALKKNSNLSDGSLGSCPSIFSATAPVVASSSASHQNFNSRSNPTPSSTSTATMISTGTSTSISASTSGLSMSAAAPMFSFGSSVAPSTLVSTGSTTLGAETTDIKTKAEKETTLANVLCTRFGDPPFAMAITGSCLIGFSSLVTSSTADSQSQGYVFGTGSGSLFNAQVPPPEIGVTTVMHTIPFSSSTSSPIFRTSGTTSVTSSSCLSSSSNPAGKLFGSGAGFGVSSSTSSSETHSVSSSSGATSGIVGPSGHPTKSHILDSAFISPSPSTGFSFGASSTFVPATNSVPMVFGSSSGASSGSTISETSATSTSSSLPSFFQVHPVFGYCIPVFTAASSNSDKVNLEGSMAEDPVQASTPVVPTFDFCQPVVSPPPAGFVSGSRAPSPALPFQFGGQQNQATPLNPSPFQASSSLDFSGGGSFSLGSGGGDKSNRKIITINKIRRQKK